MTKINILTNSYLGVLFLCCLSVPRVYAQTDTAHKELYGFVDMHAHPRDDLAFGRELFYGAPYGDIAVALGNCKADHGKKLIRSVLAAQTEQQNNSAWRDGKAGYPNFTTWPSWCSILHQQMWVDWIERAHQGGLNVMVALAVSSHTIASAAKTKGPRDDKQVLRDCIKGIKELVEHSGFMEIALTPQDVRRVVASGKLAVVLGSEMDNIGNFYSPADHYKAEFIPDPSLQQIQQELDTLWEMGIRYIFPVHLNNTVFGGTALIEPTLNVANKFVTGNELVPEQVSTNESGISFYLRHPGQGLNAVAKMFMPLLLPRTIRPSRKKNYTVWELKPGYGNRNSMGITEKGRWAISYMMKKGFLIDIDHMSEKMANEVLQMALKNNYPVNSGHSEPRIYEGKENGRTPEQYAQLKQLGGMVGMGHGKDATDFVKKYREVVKRMNYSNVAIGSDVGGFSALPQRDSTLTVIYDNTLTRCTTGNRTWDINTDGMAHYGLFPDYIKSWELAGMTAEEKKVFMSSAEHFTRMWEKCETEKNKIQ